MEEKKDIRELDATAIGEYFASVGEKSFRAKQIWRWIWQRGATSFDAMTDLSIAVRGRLSEDFCFRTLSLDAERRASDGTVKSAWRLFDGNIIESVLIPGKDKFTVCVSSQAGCALGCKFCATGRSGFKRNLTAGEIFDQVVLAKKEAERLGRTLSNVVLMGMGEPLLNYENVMRAISALTDPQGFGMSPYRITLSTAGIADGIRRLADDGVRFNLAVSLHSANDEVRSSLMPVNSADSLGKLADAVRYFVDKTGTRPTFEYLLLGGVNDSAADARELAVYCRRFPIKINVIEYNSIGDSEYRRSPARNRDGFISYLEGCNMVVNLRRSKGGDIDAACGQLAGKGAIQKQ